MEDNGDKVAAEDPDSAGGRPPRSLPRAMVLVWVVGGDLLVLASRPGRFFISGRGSGISLADEADMGEEAGPGAPWFGLSLDQEVCIPLLEAIWKLFVLLWPAVLLVLLGAVWSWGGCSCDMMGKDKPGAGHP